MAQAMTTGLPVLAEEAGATRLARQALLVAGGVAALTLAAQVQVPVPPSPVPVNLGTLAVLSVGAAYGPRLGLATILAYMGLGALGLDVFASSSAESNGLPYMMGMSGGYLVGYVLAALALGAVARRGWDRSVAWMALAMLVGNALIYAPGLLWMHHLIGAGAFDAARYASPWDQTLAWGLTPYLVGDAVKLILAALLLPGLWRAVGSLRG